MTSLALAWTTWKVIFVAGRRTRSGATVLAASAVAVLLHKIEARWRVTHLQGAIDAPTDMPETGRKKSYANQKTRQQQHNPRSGVIAPVNHYCHLKVLASVRSDMTWKAVLQGSSIWQLD
ncbi:uncharacterized protein EI90DRAFT_1904424 [Cantharellus anzutake]|uniref:uncharacterized protein n=1 Tax=Cantharellus anzutake TaxID=1750568 RepID=UPI001906D744|nr:uncharacterized protein EI90DRAFT_1904424 [Cantharellus anzutake]KAF8326552.1 hypothetical protein EI90DRAFT_1904424 [Cantharellus anzutake]